MDDFIDELINDAVIYGEVSTGAPLNWMAARGYDAKAIITHAAGHTPAKRAGWTDEEEEYLRQNLGWLSEQQIADHLGAHGRRYPYPLGAGNASTCPHASS